VVNNAFARDLLERPSIAVERGFLVGQGLPTLADDVDLLGIKLQAIADALGQFRRGERSPGTEERIINQKSNLLNQLCRNCIHRSVGVLRSLKEKP
jgi:hypothetical protein